MSIFDNIPPGQKVVFSVTGDGFHSYSLTIQSARRMGPPPVECPELVGQNVFDVLPDRLISAASNHNFVNSGTMNGEKLFIAAERPADGKDTRLYLSTANGDERRLEENHWLTALTPSYARLRRARAVEFLQLIQSPPLPDALREGILSSPIQQTTDPALRACLLFYAENLGALGASQTAILRFLTDPSILDGIPPADRRMLVQTVTRNLETRLETRDGAYKKELEALQSLFSLKMQYPDLSLDWLDNDNLDSRVNDAASVIQRVLASPREKNKSAGKTLEDVKRAFSPLDTLPIEHRARLAQEIIKGPNTVDLHHILEFIEHLRPGSLPESNRIAIAEFLLQPVGMLNAKMNDAAPLILSTFLRSDCLANLADRSLRGKIAEKVVTYASLIDTYASLNDKLDLIKKAELLDGVPKEQRHKIALELLHNCANDPVDHSDRDAPKAILRRIREMFPEFLDELLANGDGRKVVVDAIAGHWSSSGLNTLEIATELGVVNEFSQNYPFRYASGLIRTLSNSSPNLRSEQLRKIEAVLETASELPKGGMTETEGILLPLAKNLEHLSDGQSRRDALKLIKQFSLPTIHGQCFSLKRSRTEMLVSLAASIGTVDNVEVLSQTLALMNDILSIGAPPGPTDSLTILRTMATALGRNDHAQSLPSACESVLDWIKKSKLAEPYSGSLNTLQQLNAQQMTQLRTFRNTLTKVVRLVSNKTRRKQLQKCLDDIFEPDPNAPQAEDEGEDEAFNLHIREEKAPPFLRKRRGPTQPREKDPEDRSMPKAL